ncbi:MAG: HEAT repeat domain-containing protein [Promethearchaeota archaeon]
MVKTKITPREIYQRCEEFGFKNSMQMLKEIIDVEKDTSNRRKAVKYFALVSINSTSLKDECFKTLETLLVTEENIEMKCEAAKALGSLQYEKCLKPLNWMLDQKPVNSQIKLSVLKAIQNIKFDEPEIKLFINELDSEYPSIKDFVTIQLLSLNPDILINLLLNSLKSKKISNNHKIQLIKLIGYELSSINVSFEEVSFLKIKYPEILNNLIEYKSVLLEVITQILKEEDSDLMDSAITILKILGHEIEKDITKLLLIDDFIVKKNAVILCGKLKYKTAVDSLITNLDNIYNEVSIAAIEALGEIGDLTAVPELLDVLDIEDISFEYTDLDMKLYILDAIKKIYLNNRNSSYDHLYSYLKRDNNTIRESIAFILGEIGNEEFVKPLVDLLQIRNLDVKKNSIIALGKIGILKPMEHLLKILSDDETYWLIKKVAVDAIYNIFQNNWYRLKDDQSNAKRLINKNMAILNEHLGSNDEEHFKVKLSLIKLLETYGEKTALTVLMKRVNDFHRTVRIHASNAIKKIEERLELG